MSIQIELFKNAQAELAEHADRLGLSVEELARRLIIEGMAELDLDVELAAEDAENEQERTCKSR